MTYFQKLS